MQITSDMLRTHIQNMVAIRDRARAEAEQATGAILMCEALLQTLDQPADLGSDAPAMTVDQLVDAIRDQDPVLIETIPTLRGCRTIPPNDYLSEHFKEGVTLKQVVAQWWATQPEADRAAASARGFYTGDS